MELQQAKSAGDLARAIERVEALIAQVDVAIAEAWPVTVMRASAPAENSSVPAGTSIDLVPFGPASADNSALALATARATYQAQLDALQAQLAGL